MAGSDEDFQALSASALARMQSFHDAMSFHDAASDVRAIARASAGTTLTVRRDTWDVIAAAQGFERETGGIFDVAVAAPLVERGCLPAADDASLDGETSRSALDSLELHDDGRITVLSPVWIDLGGIAKGAAVDAAIDVLRAHGVTDALVNAGGDLRILGDSPRAIDVRGPGGVHVSAGTLADGAIATSGPFDAQRGALVHRGREAVWADRSVSVVAPTCLVADALTKVVAILGPAAAPLLARHGATAFSVDAAGRIDAVPAA